jgi:coronin-1B/1C/6
MSHFVRASKFRHVYVEPAKLEKCYTNLRLATATGEQNYIKGNTKFFAVSIQAGGGAMAVVPYEKVGKFDPDFPLISGHRGAILDFDFNPFHEHLIASASDDTTIKVWGIPPGGLTETCTEPLVDLTGHGRKVTLINFHPTANNILASTSSDFTVRLWDIEKGNEIVNMAPFGENLIQDLAWSWTGSTLATSCKDKIVRLYDARSGQICAQKENAHSGSKSVKLTFLGEKETFVTVGFTRQSQRQFKIWDPRKLDKELKRVDMDQAAGVIMPFYDADTNLLYLCGKGDGNIRYYEMAEGEPYAFPISEYRSTTAARGMAIIPKRACDIMSCETARLLKLTSNAVEPLHVFVPRKSDAFQDDIFPDTYAGVPSMTADEWLAGADNSPALMSLRPETFQKITFDGKRAKNVRAGSGGSRPIRVTRTVSGTSSAPAARPGIDGQSSEVKLQRELEAAKARIAELEAKLRSHGISY